MLSKERRVRFMDSNALIGRIMRQSVGKCSMPVDSEASAFGVMLFSVQIFFKIFLAINLHGCPCISF
jgi:hypothetical protein